MQYGPGTDRRVSFLLAILLCLILGSLYVATLLPGVGYSGDTANFQFVGRVLGIPHPTGYPGYLLLNHLFSRWVPIGTLAYRANLLSAVLAVAACLALFAFLLQLGTGRWVAFVSSLVFGATRTFWSQAVVAEVYTLNILFIALILILLARWRRRRQPGYFLAACAVYALSFGNHLSMVVLLPGMMLFVWMVDRRILLNARVMTCVLVFVVIGALQYTFLLWLFKRPWLRYTELQAGGLKALWIYVTGGPFQRKMFSFGLAATLTHRIPMFLKQLLREFGPLLPVVLLGAARPLNRPLAWFLGLLFLGSAAFGIGYDVGDVFVFFLPAYLAAAVFLAMGLTRLVGFAGKRGGRGVFLASLILLPLGIGAYNYRKVDERHDTGDAAAIVGILTTVDRDALILSPSHRISEFLWYYLIGEGWDQRGIYVVHHVSVEQVDAYLRRGSSFELPEERRSPPPGLKVYAIGQSHRAELEGAGLVFSAVREELYRVEAPR